MKPPPTCGRNQGMRVRKQVYELSLCDLSTFPVWEFRLDEEGEEGRDESDLELAGGLVRRSVPGFLVLEDSSIIIL